MQFFSNYILISVIFIWCLKDTDSKMFHGFTKQCSNNTPECLKDFVQSAATSFLGGIPILGIKGLDPLIFEKVELNLPGGLKITFMDGQSKGFKKCIIDSVSETGNSYEIQTHCNLTIEGKYKSLGQLVMFPVNGEGESTIICNNIKITLTFQLISKIATDGLEHLAIEGFNSKHTFEERVHYNFTNIFKGSPELSKVVLDFMNNNWRMVAEEFGNPILNYGISAIHKNVKKLFRLVPADELVLRNNEE